MSKTTFQPFSRRLWTRLSTKRPRKSPGRGKANRALRTLDLLETRTVPTGILVSEALSGNSNTLISGTVYDDVNSNGIKDNGENGLKGWTLYLDLDQSGTLNTDAVGTMEPSFVTNVDGDFSINHLKPLTYRIAEVVQSGWTPTSPAFQDITVINNKESKTDFFNFGGGNVVGTIWNDLNADGKRATDPISGEFTEPGLSGWQVFLDLNHSGFLEVTEPSTFTDADGAYAFVNVPADEYRVTEILPAGWDISPTFDDHQDVFVTALKTSSLDFANFGLTNGSIQGTMWNDLNGDGVRATDPTTGEFTEPGLADWIVFLDTNSNGIADPTETKTLTDATGAFNFSSLPQGNYHVVEVLPSGWSVAPTFDNKVNVTVEAGKAAAVVEFANFSVLNGSIRGTMWNDLNRNGVRDHTISGVFTDPGLAGWTVFLDLNRNLVLDPAEPAALTDSAGGYKVAGLQVGDYTVREVLPTGWETTATFGDNYDVTVFSGAESVAHDFANFNLATALAGSVSGTAWNDLNGNGIREGTDTGLAGRIIFVDLNGNGTLDGTEPNATSALNGTYTIPGIFPGTVTIIEQAKAGWQATAPITGLRTIALKNGENVTGIDFGNYAQQKSAIRGVVFVDSNHDGVRQAGERGLAGHTVYLDFNGNNTLDVGEPQTTTSSDLFYTPSINETGTYSFTHLAAGTYTVRFVLPVALSATPAPQLAQVVTLATSEDRSGVDCAAVFRLSEIHGTRFDDANGNHKRDLGELGVGGIKIYIDLDRDNIHDSGEPTTTTLPDGTYTFTDVAPGAYVVREVESPEYEHTYPNTKSGTLWPAGVSNPAVGKVSPSSITIELAEGKNHSQTVSITLPNSGQITDLVDVFLLFDDTGSFVNNSPIVRAAFPTIISQLQASLAGINLGFGVGRFEEYANFASEYSTGRPFTLNQPIVAASTSGYMTAIQAALNRTTPGYGGDQPETDFEALYQLVTGLGFDGNNNGSMLDSGAAGLVSTQLTPGNSGDVPSFASFTVDSSGSVFPAAGNIGGGGFRAGALPIVLLATDTGFAYQPYGESTITGVGGLTLPFSAFTQTSRPTTPYGYGAGIQQTITALNALGALVIGLGTNPQTNIDPRQGLESIARMTGAVNNSSITIANGTATPITPGSPLYFQISSGFAGSVADGVVSAIQNAATSVALDITVQSSDPRVHIINHTGVRPGIGAGQTASFDIEFVGDGIPRRFDLQFVRNGTNVVIGSIPVVIGTPIPGDCYEFDEIEEGEIEIEDDFGGRPIATTFPAKVSSVVVNGGVAQRSNVTSVQVTFDQHVTLPAIAASAFQLLRHSDSALVTLGAVVDDTGAGTVVSLSFTGGAVDNLSLQDGRYDFTIFAGSVSNLNGQLDGDGNGTGGDNHIVLGTPGVAPNLFRIFGDADGDGTVAASDFIQFRLALGGTSAIFDFDNDGAVAANDFIQFRLRFGGSI